MAAVINTVGIGAGWFTKFTHAAGHTRYVVDGKFDPTDQ